MDIACKLHLRDIRAPDRDDIRPLIEEFVGETLEPGETAAVATDRFLDRLLAQSRSREHFTALAFLEGRLIGFYQAEREKHYRKPAVRVARLIDLYVRPSFRHQGVGRALLRHAVDRFRALGAESISVLVPTQGDPAKAFIERLGFKPHAISYIASIPAYPDSPAKLTAEPLGKAGKSKA